MLGFMTDRPLSPCKDICALDARASVCTGCGRTIAEIAAERGADGFETALDYIVEDRGSAPASRQQEIVRRSSVRLGSLASQTHLKA